MTTTDRPMLFSAPMVQALLAGRKTQTRRIAKPRGRNSLLALNDDGSDFWADSYVLDPGNAEWLARSAPARVGETMYVREAFRFSRIWEGEKPSDVPQAQGDEATTVHYEADGTPGIGMAGKLHPGIHMPRWASRIEREIVSVRLERLNDCSEADAIAEGLEEEYLGQWPHHFRGWPTGEWVHGAVPAYKALWEHINGPGSWAANPRVWVIEFSPS